MLWINGGIHDPIGLDLRTDDDLCAPRIQELSRQYRDLISRLLSSFEGENFDSWRDVARELVDCAANLLEASDLADLRREYYLSAVSASLPAARVVAYRKHLLQIVRDRAHAYRASLLKGITRDVFARALGAMSYRSLCAANNISIEFRDVVCAPPPRQKPLSLAAFTSVPVPPARAQPNGVRDVAGRTTTSSGSPTPVLRALGSPSSIPSTLHCAAAPLASSEPPHKSVEASVLPAMTGIAPRSRAPSECGVAPPLPGQQLSQQPASGTCVEPTGTDADLRARDKPVPARVVALPPSPPGKVSSIDDLPEWRRTLSPRAPSHQRRRRRRRRGRHHGGNDSSPTGAPCTVPATSPARGGDHRGSRRQSSSRTTGPVAGSTYSRAEKRGSFTNTSAAYAPTSTSSSTTAARSDVLHRGNSITRSRRLAHLAARNPANEIATSRVEKRASSSTSAVLSPLCTPPRTSGSVQRLDLELGSPRRGRSRKRRSQRRSRTSSPTRPTARDLSAMHTSFATGVYAVRIAVAYMIRLRREIQDLGEVVEV
ncbi:hypothetical protein PENSPDRAFT_655570 [Peniophora sp. CONT]|nr:hypothetical protein PENSPDRAFT_655570 [Peniophora sp. CONT]